MTDSEQSGKRISDQHIQTVCLMVLAGVAGIYVVYWLRPVLVPFVVACFIVSGVGPILSYFENRFNVSRVVAAGMAFLFGVALMGIFGLTISFSIIDLAKNKDDYRNRVRQLVNMVDEQLSFDVLGFRRNSTDQDEGQVPDGDQEQTRVPDDAGKNAGSTEMAAASEQTPIADSTEAANSDSAEANADDNDETETIAATEDGPLAGDGESAEVTEPSTADDIADDNPQSADETLVAQSVDLHPLPELVETKPVPVRTRGETVESERMKEATELVDAFVRDGISVVLQAFLSLVSTSIVVLIYVFFLLLGKPAYAQTGTMREIDSQIRGYLSLKTLISIGTGAVFGITLRLFGVPMALSFGVLAFLLNFIPNIGPIVASLLPIPLILLDPSGNILWMVSVIAATSTIQVISGNVVEPKLMGNSSDLHPVSILLGLMFWGMMWGIIGMFLATPVTAAIKIVLERFEPTRQIANIMAGRWDNPATNNA